MEQKFRQIIGKVLEIPVDELGDDPACDALGQWSSLQHVQLVAAVEDIYNVRFSSREIRSFRTVAGLREILSSKGIPI
jgi:acyl carrier protein